MQSPTEKKENRKECKPVSGRVSADRKAAGSPAHMGLLLAFALIFILHRASNPFSAGNTGGEAGTVQSGGCALPVFIWVAEGSAFNGGKSDF